MENKKSFGAYICAQRKALGMTQREFADKLFLTESCLLYTSRQEIQRRVSSVSGPSRRPLLPTAFPLPRRS